MDKINQKELKVIDSIYRNADSSQRDIAKDGGFSLGLANILINRLIKKGYLKASHLDAKKVRYIITPSGMKEKARKSYGFMKRSFSVITRIKAIITDFALKQHSEGIKEFIIIGNGELSEITELVLNSLELKDVKITRTSGKKINGNNAVVFNTTQNYDHIKNQLNIWMEAEKLYGSSYEIQ